MFEKSWRKHMDKVLTLLATVTPRCLHCSRQERLAQTLATPIELAATSARHLIGQSSHSDRFVPNTNWVAARGCR
jgi:hypothetical protein